MERRWKTVYKREPRGKEEGGERKGTTKRTLNI